MKPPYRERHYDYKFGPTEQPAFANIAAGQIITGITLPLELDAPFVLRSRALRMGYSNERRITGLQFLNLRYTGPNRDYRQQAMIPQTIEGAYFGLLGNPMPVYPDIIYPAGGVIQVDIQNTGAGAITNLELYFRGVKLYPWGQRPDYTYADKARVKDYKYPLLVSQLPVTTTAQGIRYVFQVKPEADFVLRGGQAGRSFAPFTYETFIRWYDWDLKPYSNAPVHTDMLFGNAANPAAFPTGPTPVYVTAVGPGAANPGLFYPEIYLPRNQIMYYDIVRQDAFVPGAAAQDFPITLIGSEVYQ